MKKTLLWAILLISGLSSISQENLRKYYFNICDLSEGKVYKFIDINNPNNIQYWHLYYKIENSDTLLFTEGLDDKYRPIEVFVEKIKNDETKMADYYYLNYDSLGNVNKISTEIVKNEVYSFEDLSKSLIWSVKYLGSYGLEMLSKKRTLMIGNEEYEMSSVTYECIKFKDNFTIKWLDSGQEYSFYQESLYAEKLGLVSFKRTLPDGIILDYQLSEILEIEYIKTYYKDK